MLLFHFYSSHAGWRSKIEEVERGNKEKERRDIELKQPTKFELEDLEWRERERERGKSEFSLSREDWKCEWKSKGDRYDSIDLAACVCMVASIAVACCNCFRC